MRFSAGVVAPHRRGYPAAARLVAQILVRIEMFSVGIDGMTAIQPSLKVEGPPRLNACLMKQVAEAPSVALARVNYRRLLIAIREQ
jgi:hypothetical protein